MTETPTSRTVGVWWAVWSHGGVQQTGTSACLYCTSELRRQVYCTQMTKEVHLANLLEGVCGGDSLTEVIWEEEAVVDSFWIPCQLPP